MLRRGAFYLLIAALALMACPTVTPPVAAVGGTLVVDVDNPSCTGGPPDSATITGALASATGGETIRVCEGDYTEDTLTINVSVTITGPGATPEDDGVATVHHGTGGASAMVDINANGVIFEGLDLDATPPPAWPFQTSGIVGDGNDVTIQDNEIHDATSSAVSMGGVTFPTNVNILRNNVHDNGGGIGCMCDDSGLWSNTVDGAGGNALALEGNRGTIGGNEVTNGTVSVMGNDMVVQNNQISAGTASSTIYVSGNSVTVTNNNLSDADYYGIDATTQSALSTSVTITRNTFTQIRVPIQLSDWDPNDAFGLTATIGGSPSEANTFVDSGDSLGDLSYLVEMDGPTANVNAEYNNWGLCTAAEIEQEIYHQVDDPAQGLVDFEPFIAPDSCAAPTPSPTPSPSPTPPAGPTRTLVWGPGWQNATWSGASTPEEAFACAAGNYAAAYRLVGGGWERHFPDRPEISNMGPLEPYDAFLILITGDVTCEMPVADPPGTERTLDWGVGWQNDGWTDPDGTPPQNAFACAAGSYAAAYRLVSGGWERYFPDRPDISNMGLLNRYDAFLILVTAPVSCTMPIAPGGAASESPFIGAWESTDFDGSHQTLTVGGGGGGVYHVTVFDDKATGGCPQTQGSATATGSGSVEGDTLHVGGSVLCPSEGETYPWEADFTHDSSDDTVSGPLGPYSVQWNRIGH
jgi:hypothetical protein